jgi:hypothetical protein
MMMRLRSYPPPGALLALPVAVALWIAGAAEAALPLATTSNDFKLPGTQPLTVTDNFLAPSSCTPCHSNFGEPENEPFRTWQASMMAQAGRDPLMYAALAVANQDASFAGETCIRCHLPKGWLEGRSAAADGTLLTADDRHGVQCSVCHRLVDPFPGLENPPEDAAILAGLAAPVTVLGNAMMVVDPLDRLRGPFDVVGDLGSDPHIPDQTTLISPFHQSSELCGVCHNVRNTLFTRNGMTGEYELNAVDAPGDPALGFPEQSTYDEWAASTYASGGVTAPEFGINKDVVESCQDCHMPDVTGHDAEGGLERDDLPRHEMVGANTFIPDVLPHHPLFGSEVDAGILQEGIGRATAMLRKAATLTLDLSGGNLTVRVTNESGHKLPTGYPEGRRLWLHVRAFDAARNVIFESGRYVFSTATLEGYDAQPLDPDYDPHLRVWESHMGISPAVAAATGLPGGRTFHLALNNVRLKDNRIPPRGFANAAFEAFDGHPVGATYADGAHWDDVVYPVGAGAVQAEVVLYYQTASREYVEFLRDENTTTATGNILFDLWDQHNKSVPVEMAHAFLETDVNKVNGCHKKVAKLQERYRKTHMKEWAGCFEREARGLSCDTARRDERIAAAEAKLRAKLGGVKDGVCAGKNLTPVTLGHGRVCPVPCPTLVLFDMNDLASCGICMTERLSGDALEAAYGARLPDEVPDPVPGTAVSCQRALDSAADELASGWPKALSDCELANRTGKNAPPVDCATDPDGKIAASQEKAARKINSCDDFSGIAGCAAGGDAASTRACMEAVVGAIAPAFVEVPYP